ncbi:MAG: phosphoadenylyl-sulfate reductase [Actinobacteria bacterium]|nr:phosphoadenylyl-sulfate reductase [Actinomycetota bacterium]
MDKLQIKKLALKFEDKTAEDVLKWAFDRFNDQVALASSFGAEDVLLIDMILGINPHAQIFTLDTGRLPQETYDTWNTIQQRYSTTIQPYFPNDIEAERMVAEHGPNQFYSSVENRRLCCTVRKVNPLKRALSRLDAWITGLRREQAITRVEVKKIEWDETNDLVKLNPIVDWTEQDVWDYIRRNKVPYNPLHDKGYPSIGCAPCTRAIQPDEDVRAGRWWWESADKKECGLHK